MSRPRGTAHASLAAGLVAAGLAGLVACSAGDSARSEDPGGPPSATTVEAPPPCGAAGAADATSCTPAPTSSNAAPTATAPLEPLRVRFLGVQGFLVEHGDQALLTAPLFTRPSMIAVTTGGAVTSDGSLVAKYIPAATLPKIKAVLSGHAHYDHLLDTPAVMARAPAATLYSNRSTKNLLAAFAPDRGASCAGTPAQADVVARSRVVALDDPAKSAVDYTACPEQRPAGAPLDGRWVRVPGAPMRVLAVCSAHQDQFGPVHFAPGDVTEEACTPPTRMDLWKEGRTLGYLVDFLDPVTDEPLYRVYYEDSPAGSPVGQVPARWLTGKRVDLALLCVGTYDEVDGAPGNTLASLAPRYALGGHWEDFFRGADEQPQAIAFLDVEAWDARARTALPAAGEPLPMKWNGQALSERVVRPRPGDAFEIR